MSTIEERGSTEELPAARGGDPTRRQFLEGAACALAACAGAAALGPAAVAVFSPLDGGIVTVGGDGKMDLGPVEQFEPGKPKKLAVRAARTDAYLKFGERALGSVLVVRDDRGFTVWNATCPHLGCDVGIQDDTKLVCPCHDSRFGQDGKLESGPAPRSLDVLEHTIAGGRLSVVFKRFRTGVPEKQEI